MEDIQIRYKWLDFPVIEYAICWHIKLKDGKDIGFTNHNDDIEIDGFNYLAKALIGYDAIHESIDTLKSINEISGIIDHELIREDDILKGKFDNALLSIYLVHYRHSEQHKHLLKQGYIGNIKYSNNQFYADIIPLVEKLSANITQSFSPYCRAKFCDERCKLNKSIYTKIGQICKIINKNSFLDEDRNEDNYYYNFSTIKFLSGENKSITLRVSNFHNKIVEVILSPMLKLNLDDKYEIIAGCDKNFSTCINKFNNAINFRGEPHISNVIKQL